MHVATPTPAYGMQREQVNVFPNHNCGESHQRVRAVDLG